MKNFFLFIILLVASVSVLLLVRFNKENGDVTRILEQERYSRMTAEEELQRGEYRVKKLEADLQTTQVKLSRNQEALDKCKDESQEIRTSLERAQQQGRSQESTLRKELDDALAALDKKAELEAKFREAQDELRAVEKEVRQLTARAEAAERKIEQQEAAAAAMAASAKK